MATEPTPMRVQEFVSRLKHMLTEFGDYQIAWFLGAGCSVSSGIPAANALVQDWLKVRHGGSPSAQELEAWTKGEYPQFSGSYATLYGAVVEQLFDSPELRQMEVERLTLRKQPGFGYATLAQLINKEHVGQRCNTVLTVNFDDLVADALYLYAGQRPRIIAHESLMHYVRGSSARPYVVKLHGDTYLGAKNTAKETCELAKPAQQALAKLVGERAVIFLGYGGNDRSIGDAFASLPEDNPRHGVYWVGSNLPGGTYGEWLRARGVRWVKHHDFDELMLMLRKAFDLPLPNVEPFDAMLDNFRKRFEELSQKVQQAAPSVEKAELTAALDSVVQKAKDWWAVEFEAYKFKDADPDKADAIYRAGLVKFPNCEQLLGNYAVFLQQRGRLDDAEQFYLQAVEADPKYGIALCNYALYLKQRARLGEAESYFLRAFESDPENGNALGGYALLLAQRGDLDEAEHFFQRALESEPKHATNLNNYAAFLHKQGRMEEAEPYYRRVLDDAPMDADSLGPYAYLLYQLGRLEEAESYYRRALEANPKHANNLAGYALYLQQRDRPDEAESHYRRAIAIEPNNANTFGNLAGLLLGLGRAEGVGLLQQAMQLAEGDKKWEICLLECLLYADAHGVAGLRRQEWRQRMCELLTAGVRSKGWDFSRNIARAEQDGHTDLDNLKLLADVISDKKPFEALAEAGICPSIAAP